MTYFIGTIVTKYVHVTNIFNSVTNKLVADSRHFDNNNKGFNLLLSLISKLDDYIAVFESTAYYYQNLFNFLILKNYKYYLINPLVIPKFRRLSVRNINNDNVNSKSIAQYLMFNYQYLTE